MTTIRHQTASAVVLDQHGRVLLVHHNKTGLWLYPGGHPELNEDPAATAIRETVEETGIKVEVIGTPGFNHPAVQPHIPPWAVIEMDVTDAKVGTHRHIDLVYVCRPIGGRLSAQLEEVSAARWTPLGEVATLPTPAELPALVTAAADWTTTPR